MPGEGGGGLDLVSIIAALGAFLGGLFSSFSVDAAWLKGIFTKLGDFLNASFRKIIDFLSVLWHNITDLLGRIWKAIKVLVQDLGDAFGKVIGTLKKLRDWLDMVYGKYLRPILILLQHIRQMLVILRLFHIAIADKLDKYLQQLQADIQKPFLLIRGTLNGVLDVLELIVDPRGILMSGPFLWSVWRDLGQLARMLHLQGIFGSATGSAAARGHYAGYFQLGSVKTRAALNARGKFDDYQLTQKAEMDAALKANAG